jgi:LmbE family N-acetylglucosaminyl deacetylase
MNERILVVAAHPDDDVLGCGGTIARFRDAGADVRVIFLAEGITARYEPSQFDDPDVRARSERRNRNAVRALDILGVPADSVFVNARPCARLDGVPMIDLAKEIERHLADFKPNRVFTHTPDDPNVDHGLAFRATLVAVRPVNRPWLRAVYSYEVLSSTEWNTTAPFAPTAFFDVTATIERKVSALAAYEDEMRPIPHPRSPETLRALAQFRGAQAGVRYAEGFGLIRSLDH